jgi:TorA maturation chaperone TorD
MQPVDQTGRILTCLRNFFISRQASELAKACIALSHESSTSVPVATTNWQDVEFAFNKLFVGPQAILAPPFASIYLENEPHVMGETTLMVRRLYQMVGLVSPWKGRIPEDHISLELDACLHMRMGLLENRSSQLCDIYSYFLNEHMARWIPAFLSKINETQELPPAIGWVGRELENWLACECQWVCQPPGNSRNH